MSLIQVEKYISLQDFLPKWTELKESVGDKPIGRGKNALDIGNGKLCMVGEAYEFTKDYWMLDNSKYCKVCTDFSLGNSIYCIQGSVRDFYLQKEKLYNHMIEAHPELMRVK